MTNEKAPLYEILSPYLEQTLENYKAFLSESCPLDAKGMTAYQNACKAVLSHIALLMKLIEDQTDEMDHKNNTLSAWIEKAKGATDLQEDLDVEFD